MGSERLSQTGEDIRREYCSESAVFTATLTATMPASFKLSTMQWPFSRLPKPVPFSKVRVSSVEAHLTRGNHVFETTKLRLA